MTDLSLDPAQGGMLSDVDMHDPACAQLHDHEYIDHCEKGGVLRQKIACKDLVAVVLNKCFPRLAIVWACSLHHVLADRARCMIDSELEIELFKDLVLAPDRVVHTHAANEVDVLAWDLGSADPVYFGFTAPVELEALAVPSDHSFRVDEDQGCLPTVPESRERHPECPIGRSQPRSFMGSLVYRELLSQSKVLQDQCTLGSEE